MPFDFLASEPDIIVLDLETTVQKVGDKKDNSPFNPANKCVSGHWLTIDDLGQMGPVNSRVWHHDEKPLPDDRQSLQDALDRCNLLVAHNAKFDVLWLLQMGFRIPERVYCTMIGEYIYARGLFEKLSLGQIAERRNVTRKKSDLVDGLFKSGIGFEAMPLDTVIEYAEADVQSCAEIYLQQKEDLTKAGNTGLAPVFDLMNEMLLFLVEIETNGIRIDMQALEDVEAQFVAEKQEIEKRLREIVSNVMGDTPINLNSGADMTMVVYSRKVKDRKAHVEKFNIGLNAAGKPLRRPKMNKSQFAKAVRETTEVVDRTVLHCCSTCAGTGKQYKVRKDGQPYKNQPKCLTCKGEGVVYLSNGRKAGLKLVPEGAHDATVNGFSTDKATIKRLIAQAEDKGNAEAISFLSGIMRLNAVSTYLDSFVAGIKRWTRSNGILHPNFNQTVVATGRLSSSDPNFQNQPKGGKFPIRRAVVSRFLNGTILEADFSGLEFVMAGELSRDEQIIADVLNGKDVHRQTASIIHRILAEDISKDQRQDAKPTTFKPLYGGMGFDEPAHIRKYFDEYFQIYKGLARWHKELMDGVLKDGMVRIFSGREYHFPNAKRFGNGQVSGATKIKNFPVQGAATGDIVPLACIRAKREFKRLGLRSLLILTVHDSIVVDVYPGEREAVIEALRWAMEEIADEVKERWNYEMILPLRIEIEDGANWMQQEQVYPRTMANAA